MRLTTLLGVGAVAALAGIAQAQFTLNWTARVGSWDGVTFAPLASQPSPLVVGQGQAVQYQMSWTSTRQINDSVNVAGTPGLIAGVFYVGGNITASTSNLNGGVIGGVVPQGPGNSTNGVVGLSNQGVFNGSQFIPSPGFGAPAPSGIFFSVTRQPTGAAQVPAQVDFGSAAAPVWQFTWVPTSFTPRAVNWGTSVPAALAALGGPAQYLVNVDADPQNAFTDAFLPTTVNYGTIPTVNVIPAPGSVALVALGGLIAARRRRA
jgi:hypothetical protein